jgi:glycosyltransferase involved in cell wall biosynthesis
MNNLSEVTIIIPCYNEELNLIILLPKLKSFVIEKNCSIIIVNDGSTDRTYENLKTVANNNIHVVTHTRNRGYGGAIKSGIAACNTKYCVTIDGDGQHDLEDIEQLFSELVNQKADLVVGNRSGKGSSRFRNFGKWLIKKFTKAFVDLEIEDLNSGMKFYKTEVVRSLFHWAPNDMAYSETITLLHNNFRYKIVEVGIRIFDRELGESTISYKTAIRTVKEISFLILNFNPFRFFGLLGGGISFSGLLWSLPFLLKGAGLTIGSGFLMSFGILVMILGVMLQTITRMKFENYKPIIGIGDE